MTVKKIDDIDYEKLNAAEKELNKLAQDKTLVIAKTLEGTKGYTQGFVISIVSELIKNSIEAQFQISSGTLGIDSAGPIFHILVPVENLEFAKNIIDEILAK